jgi:dihydroorotate dehydrogenase (NAD+) catalytic subunit
LRCVFELYQTVKVPIIGVGGVETSRDALEYLMAGATAVQIGSGVGRRGMKVFREVTEGMRAYMEENDIASVIELKGVAHVQ